MQDCLAHRPTTSRVGAAIGFWILDGTKLAKIDARIWILDFGWSFLAVNSQLPTVILVENDRQVRRPRFGRLDSG